MQGLDGIVDVRYRRLQFEGLNFQVLPDIRRLARILVLVRRVWLFGLKARDGLLEGCGKVISYRNNVNLSS